MNSIEKLLNELDIKTDETPLHHLVVYNDNVNSFDHVIWSLMSICSHTPTQAEQCAHIIHNNGKCSVKQGEYEELVKYNNQLSSNGLTVEIK